MLNIKNRYITILILEQICNQNFIMITFIYDKVFQCFAKKGLFVGSREPSSSGPFGYFHPLDWVLGATTRGVTITVLLIHLKIKKPQQQKEATHGSNHTTQYTITTYDTNYHTSDTVAHDMAK